MRRLMLLALSLLLLSHPAASRSTHGVPDAQSESAAWWGDMSQGYVVSGCLPTPEASALVRVPPCQAYAIDATAGRLLRYIWEASARTVPLTGGDGRYWLGAHATVAEAVAGWTRQAGTHYVWIKQDARPVEPSGVVVLASAHVAAGVVTSVGDFRPDSPLAGPVNVLSPLYAVRGDGTTDDTVGVQTAINAAAWQDRRLVAPRPPVYYAFTRLWLAYDATFNPGFPPAGIEQGNLHVACEGESTTASTVTGPRMETFFVSTDATGPALNADKVGQPGNPLRNVKLEGCSFEATNTTRVIDFKGLNSNVDLANLYIVQHSSAGGGMLCEDCFLLRMKNLFLFHASDSDATAVGAGLILRNAATPGGIFLLDNVTARGWGGPGGTCIIFGHTDLVLAKLINNIDGRGVQGIGCDINVRLAGGAVAGHLSTLHVEGAKTTGMWLSHGARNWTLSSPFFENPNASLADLRLGNEPASAIEEATAGLTLIDPVFNSVRTVGILRETTATTARTVIINPAFVAQSDGVGVGIQCALEANIVLNGVTIFGAGFAPSPNALAEPYKYCEQVSILEDPNFVRFGAGVAFGPVSTVQLSTLLEGHATLDFPIVSAGTCTQLTFAVLGARTIDTLSPQWPGDGIITVPNLDWFMAVSAPDVVTVRACNRHASASSGDAGPLRFGALVWQQEAVAAPLTGYVEPPLQGRVAPRLDVRVPVIPR